MSKNNAIRFNCCRFLSGSSATKEFKRRNLTFRDRVRFTHCVCDRGRFFVPTQRVTLNCCDFADLFLDDLNVYSQKAEHRTVTLRDVNACKMWVGEGNTAFIEYSCCIGKLVVNGSAGIHDAKINELIITSDGDAYVCDLTKLNKVEVHGKLRAAGCDIKAVHLAKGGSVFGLGKNEDESIIITADNGLFYDEKEDLWIGY